jgi:hypothetical protein
MPILFQPTLSAAHKAAFQATDTCKALETSHSHHPTMESTWHVEYARELAGHFEFLLFRSVPGGNGTQPLTHLLVTVHPDRTESTVRIDFQHAGADRLTVKHHPHDPTPAS